MHFFSTGLRHHHACRARYISVHRGQGPIRPGFLGQSVLIRVLFIFGDRHTRVCPLNQVELGSLDGLLVPRVSPSRGIRGVLETGELHFHGTLLLLNGLEEAVGVPPRVVC